MPMLDLLGASRDGQCAGARMHGPDAAKDGRGCSPGRRQPITEFTPSAIRNLRETCWAVLPSFLAHDRRSSFLTITYPDEDCERHAEQPRLHKRHLSLMGKWFVRHYKESWAIWRLEYSESGKVHFHILVYWGFVPASFRALREELAQYWSSLIAQGRRDLDPGVYAKNLKAGVTLEPIRNVDGLIRYITKDAGQRTPLDEDSQRVVKQQGRWWGVWGRANYKQAVVLLRVHLPVDVAWEIWRGLELKWIRHYRNKGLTVDTDPATYSADIKYLPRWASSAWLAELVRETLGQRSLYDYWMTDLTTGKVWPPGSWVARAA